MLRIIALPLMLLLAFVTQAMAAEPLLGTWKLTSQMIDGQKADSEDMTLRIYTAGDGFEFAYSTPVNGIYLVSMRFTSIHLDGREGSVLDVRGNKMGAVRITKLGPLEYKAVIEGPNRPKATSRMTISADDKTLTSESVKSDSGPGVPRVVQVFSRS